MNTLTHTLTQRLGTRWPLIQAPMAGVQGSALALAARHTQITTLFTGGAARGIVGRVMRELGPLNPAAPPFPLAATAIAPLRAAAEKMGDTGFTPLWSGQNATGCQSAPAAQITAALARGF